MKKFTRLFLTLTVLLSTTISVLANTAPVVVNTYDSQGNVLVAKFKVWKGPNYVGEFNTGSAANLDVGSTYTLFAHYDGTSTARQTFVVDILGNTFDFSTTKVTFHWSGGYLNFRTSGSWSSFGKTNGVWNSRELFPKDANGNTMQFQIGYLWNDVRGMVFEMDYEGLSNIEKVLSQLRLRDHLGNPIAGGKARGGFAAPTTYHVNGLTNSQGLLLDIQNGSNQNRSFEMTINGTSKQSAQQLSSIYDFQTDLLTLRLETCDGNPLDGGHVRWGHGTNFGTTHFIGGNTGSSGAGETSAEMFPGIYSFEMGYNSTTDTKISHNFPTDGATLVFKTSKVTLNYDNTISYGGPTGTSKWFTKPSMELMPGGTYKFKFTGGSLLDITIPDCSFDAALIRLVDENNAPLANLDLGNMLTYKSRCGGNWTYSGVPFQTDANGCALLNNSCAANNWDGKITVSVNKTSKEQVVATNSTYQVAPVNVTLKTCEGLPLAGGTVHQGSGSWTPRGTTDASGKISFYAFPGTTVVARMTYNYGSLTQNNVPVVLPVTDIDFVTTKVTLYGNNIQIQTGGWPAFTSPMELLTGTTYNFRFNGIMVYDVNITGCEMNKGLLQVKNEKDGSVAGATFVPACGGSWQPQIVGSTDDSGYLFADIPECMTKIKATVGSSSQELSKAQLISSNYTWTTEVLRINFKDHDGNFITDCLGTIKSGGGWPIIGNFNSSGYFEVNSFPATTGFRVTYNNTSETKNFTVIGGAGVQVREFQTGQVNGPCITQYSAGGWSTFTDGIELMPGDYTFRYPSQIATVTAGNITNLICPEEEEKSAIFGDGTIPEFSYKLYPVPANSRLNVHTTLIADEQVEYQVFDLTGRTMKNGIWKLNRGFNTNVIELNDLVEGQYIFKLKTSGKVITEKFSINKN